MSRLIEFLLLLGAAYWLYARWRSNHRIQESTNRPKQSTPVEQPVQQMVACAHCNLRLPMSEALAHSGNYFCDASHRDAINAKGWLGLATHSPSPNFNERPDMAIDTLVIHHISLPEGKFGGGYIEDFFCNRLNVELDPYFKEIGHLQVSSHFLIDRQGHLTQFVSCNDRAWHAGMSNLFERDQCNDFSIGIELEGTGELAYESAQYEMLATLTQSILKKYPIQYIVGHSDISPVRKTDPGPSFDWELFRKKAHISEMKLPFGTASR
jgi:AmpD protein